MVAEKNSPTNIWNISTADATAIRAQQRSFESWGEVSRAEVALSGRAAPNIMVGRASAGFFKAVGIPVARGRSIEPRDEAPKPPRWWCSPTPWRSGSGGAEQAIGRSLNLNGAPHQVIGVLPPGRNELGGVTATAWTPLKLPAPVRRGPFWMRGMGRLKEGVTVEMAPPIWPGSAPESSRSGATSGTASPSSPRFPSGSASSAARTGRWDSSPARCSLVLLLAVTNVATLVLVRASAREPGGGAGDAGRGHRPDRPPAGDREHHPHPGRRRAGIAAGLLRPEARDHPAHPAPDQNATLDWRAVAVAFSAALISGIVVSLSPIAALASRGGPMRADARRAAGRTTNRVRSALVTAEFALALPLLVVAGLLLNSFVRLSGSILARSRRDRRGRVSLPTVRYPDSLALRGFWRRAEDTAAGLPGGRGTRLRSSPDSPGTNNFNLVDHPVPDGTSEPVSPWYGVSAGYFEAMGIPLLDGRMFTANDRCRWSS